MSPMPPPVPPDGGTVGGGRVGGGRVGSGFGSIGGTVGGGTVGGTGGGGRAGVAADNGKDRASESNVSKPASVVLSVVVIVLSPLGIIISPIGPSNPLFPQSYFEDKISRIR